MRSPTPKCTHSRRPILGRQYTGRIVAISNKATITEPVFNYSATFDFIWEEVRIPVSYQDDWRTAESIMNEEAVRISASDDAERALAQMIHHYPLARTEVEPRVFVRATDNYLEIAARFVVPIRTARWSKDKFTQRILDRFEQTGIAIASETADITIRPSKADEGLREQQGTQPPSA